MPRRPRSTRRVRLGRAVRPDRGGPSSLRLQVELSHEQRIVSVVVDEEHNALLLEIDDRSAGYPRVSRAGVEFAQTPDFRALVNSYRDVADIRGPMVVAQVGADAMATDAASARMLAKRLYLRQQSSDAGRKWSGSGGDYR